MAVDGDDFVGSRAPILSDGDDFVGSVPQECVDGVNFVGLSWLPPVSSGYSGSGAISAIPALGLFFAHRRAYDGPLNG